ncbi:MAG: DUF885 domain-containing protein [Kofleriaceae bacterium]
MQPTSTAGALGRGLARRALLGAAISIAAACAPASRPVSRERADYPTDFGELAAFIAGHLQRIDPAGAVALGVHKYDGELPDLTPAGLADASALLRRDREALAAVVRDELTPTQAFEREVLLIEIGQALFRIVELDSYRSNPMSYSGAINLDAYMIRDYTPADQRAAAVIQLCTRLPAHLAQARFNLKLPMPRPWLDTAILQTHGMLEFADRDVRAAFGPELARRTELDAALDTCKAALAEHESWLTAQHKLATADGFALGAELFLRMLSETQGITTDLATLDRLAEADLERNLAAIEQAARAIDPARPVADVVRAAADDRPLPAEVLTVATDQATAMRRFVIEHRIATIPSDDRAVVRESPPFRRWNSAFLDTPGPFETTPFASYYYITPPDPSWPEDEQRAYVPPRNDLLFTTIHEVYPGHFLQHLHIRNHPSRIVQSMCTSSTTEGWAHYTEEMMYDEGAGGRTPQVRIGMLKKALLRNVRFVVTLGLHTRGLTVDQATELFRTKAFLDPRNSKQQATRGTFDPMYLAYTIGKLMIIKLRNDWMAAHPGKPIGEFHDAFLGHGCAPIPVIRRAMLGAEAGPAL